MRTGSELCSGSLIAQQWILTAAHCVHHYDTALGRYQDYPPSDYFIRIGTSTGTSSDGFATGVEEIDTFPVYDVSVGNAPVTDHDIALMKLQAPVFDELNLAPLPLRPSASGIPSGADVRLAGWGMTIDGDKGSAGVKLNWTAPGAWKFNDACYLSDTTCYDWKASGLPPSSWADHGDSGGPYVTKAHGDWVEIGPLTGTVVPTADSTPQYGSSALYYLSWIRSHTGLPTPQANTIVQANGKSYLVDGYGFRRSIVDVATYDCLVNSGIPALPPLTRYQLLSIPQDHDHNAVCDGTGPGAGSSGQPAITSTILSSAPNPSVHGQSVTLTANVTSGTGTPAGTVSFYDNGALIGSDTLDGGNASVSATGLSTGTHTLSAIYPGTGDYTESSDTITQIVNKAATTTALMSAANPAVYCQTVRFSSTVAPVAPGAGTPTGQLTLADGGSSAGTGTLDGSGNGYVDTQFFTIGHHSMVMSYGGDQNFYDSTSSALDQVVNKAPTLTTVTAAPASSNLFGRTSTFTAAVTVPPPGCGTPTGGVSFDIDGTTVAHASLNTAATASFSTTALTPGQHVVTAFYAGDDHFLASQGRVSYKVTCTRVITGAVNSNVTASGESTCLIGAQVNGSVTVPAGTRFAAMNSTISGAVVAIKTPGMTFLCGSRVGGSINVEYAKELVLVGDQAALCAPNTANGSLILRYNSHGVEAIGNTIAQLVLASNSGPGPYGQSTTIVQNRLKAS